MSLKEMPASLRLEAITSRIALLTEIGKTLDDEATRLVKLKAMKAVVKELYKRLKKEEVFHTLRTRQGRSNSTESLQESPFRQTISPFELADLSTSVDLDQYSSGSENLFDEGLFWMDMQEAVPELRTASE